MKKQIVSREFLALRQILKYYCSNRPDTKIASVKFIGYSIYRCLASSKKYWDGKTLSLTPELNSIVPFVLSKVILFSEFIENLFSICVNLYHILEILWRDFFAVHPGESNHVYKPKLRRKMDWNQMEQQNFVINCASQRLRCRQYITNFCLSRFT